VQFGDWQVSDDIKSQQKWDPEGDHIRLAYFYENVLQFTGLRGEPLDRITSLAETRPEMAEILIAVLEACKRAELEFVFQTESLLQDQFDDAPNWQHINRLAHDLRRPVAIIARAVEKLDSTHRENLHDTFSEAVESIRWAADIQAMFLRNFESLPRERRVRRPKPVVAIVANRLLDLTFIVETAVRRATPALDRRGFGAESIAYRDLKKLPTLYVDGWMILHTMLCLILKAVDRAFAESAKFSVQMSSSYFQNYYAISVADYGVGITTEEVERAFEADRRWLPPSEWRLPSSCGLSLARKFARRHGGEIVVENLFNPTVFSLRLPTSLATSPPSE
jgi:signal transduction histidine kinase